MIASMEANSSECCIEDSEAPPQSCVCVCVVFQKTNAHKRALRSVWGVLLFV